MRIARVKFKNYRQFKDVELVFEHLPDRKDLHVLIGVMGTGKSNLLNAINWCLYGEEPFLSRENDQDFPLLNIRVLGDGQASEEYRVCVELDASSGNRHVTFIREEWWRVETTAASPSDVSKTARKVFRVTLENEDGTSNIFEGDDAQDKVELFIPDGIKEFYFFDGERLDKYFKEATGQNIRNAIYQISQIDLLDRTHKHLERVVGELQKDAGRLSPEIETTRQELEAAKHDLAKHKKDIAESEQQVTIAKDRIGELEDNLKTLPQTEELEAERAQLKQSLEEKDSLLKKKVSKKDALVFSRAVCVLLKPAIQETIDIIRQKHVNDELPPTLDKDLLEKLLTDAQCICGTDLLPGSPEAEAIQKVVQTITLSSEVAQQLMLIESPLVTAMDSVDSFLDELHEIAHDISSLETEMGAMSDRIVDIDKKLATYDMAKIRAWISERKKLEDTLAINQRKLGVLEHLREQSATKFKQLKNQLDDELNKESKSADLKRDISFAENSMRVLEKAKGSILESFRKEIERKTEENFFRLHWKKKGRTYKAVSINTDYTVSPVHSMGYDAISILSGGEREVLALSFSTALYEISGFDAGIVVDRPFAMVSGPPLKMIAEMFSNISDQRQVILLLTPEDYGSDVRGALEHDLSTRLTLELREDEKEVKFKES